MVTVTITVTVTVTVVRLRLGFFTNKYASRTVQYNLFTQIRTFMCISAPRSIDFVFFVVNLGT